LESIETLSKNILPSLALDDPKQRIANPRFDVI
jgi:hypothetical protein